MIGNDHLSGYVLLQPTEGSPGRLARCLDHTSDPAAYKLLRVRLLLLHQKQQSGVLLYRGPLLGTSPHLSTCFCSCSVCTPQAAVAAECVWVLLGTGDIQQMYLSIGLIHGNIAPCSTIITRRTLSLSLGQLAQDNVWLLNKCTDILLCSWDHCSAVTSPKAYAACRLMKTLQELLDSLGANLDPAIDYEAQLCSGGYRTPNSIEQADYPAGM